MEQQAFLAGGRHRTVAPDGRRREAGRQDLLRKLPHRDLVVVGVLAAPQHDPSGPGHDRRDEQRGLVLRNRGRVE